LDKEPELREYLFPAQFNRIQKEEKLRKVLDEWENVKCFKHI